VVAVIDRFHVDRPGRTAPDAVFLAANQATIKIVTLASKQ